MFLHQDTKIGRLELKVLSTEGCGVPGPNRAYATLLRQVILQQLWRSMEGRPTDEDALIVVCQTLPINQALWWIHNANRAKPLIEGMAKDIVEHQMRLLA